MHGLWSCVWTSLLLHTVVYKKSASFSGTTGADGILLKVAWKSMELAWNFVVTQVYEPCIEQYTFCTAAIFDFKWPPSTIIFNQYIFYLTHTIVGISLLSRSSISFLRDIVKTRYLRGSILKSRLADQKVFCSNGNIGFWFHECLSFPKIYLLTTLHKM